jgi:predicted secreted hydrolase
MMRTGAASWVRAAHQGVALAVVAVVATGVAAGAGPVQDLGPLTAAPAADFAQVSAPRAFVFPQDHGPHPQFRQEWWYLTGNLDSDDGERFGFELTFFRIALAPPGQVSRASTDSRWRTQQVYVAHFAVTDVSRKRFRSVQKLSRDALGLAGAQTEPFRVWLDDWRVAGDGPAWTLRAAQDGYDLALELRPLGPPVLNGEDGLSRKSGERGSASYYYSIPRLAVRGQLVRDGRTLSVSGLAWLDREWGSGSLSASEAGWDWFALQLDDGSALMFYSLRNRDGTREAHSAGTWVDASGSVHALSSADVAISSAGRWASPRGGSYPASWRVRVPQLGLDVAVQPVLPDQELSTTPRYWEGAVDVTGTRGAQPVRGRGYVELVGYANAVPGR